MREKSGLPKKALSIILDRPTLAFIDEITDHLEATSISEVIRRAWSFNENLQEEMKISGLFSIRHDGGSWLDVCAQEDFVLEEFQDRINISLPKRIIISLKEISKENGVKVENVVKIIVFNMHASILNQIEGNFFQLATDDMNSSYLFCDLLPLRSPMNRFTNSLS